MTMVSNFAPLTPIWYEVGPDLAPGEPAWSRLWERSLHVDDGHTHAWESVLMPSYPGSLLAEVLRCGVCLCPCCAGIRDETPCIRRLRHAGDHEAPTGERWPVGSSPNRRRS